MKSYHMDLGYNTSIKIKKSNRILRCEAVSGCTKFKSKNFFSTRCCNKTFCCLSCGWKTCQGCGTLQCRNCEIGNILCNRCEYYKSQYSLNRTAEILRNLTATRNKFIQSTIDYEERLAFLNKAQERSSHLIEELRRENMRLSNENRKLKEKKNHEESDQDDNNYYCSSPMYDPTSSIYQENYEDKDSIPLKENTHKERNNEKDDYSGCPRCSGVDDEAYSPTCLGCNSKNIEHSSSDDDSILLIKENSPKRKRSIHKNLHWISPWPLSLTTDENSIFSEKENISKKRKIM